MSYESAAKDFQEAIKKLQEETNAYAEHPKCNDFILQQKEQRINKLIKYFNVVENYLSELEMENIEYQQKAINSQKFLHKHIREERQYLKQVLGLVKLRNIIFINQQKPGSTNGGV